MKVAAIQAETAPRAAGGYAQAVEVRDARRFVFVSGQIPETVDGVVPDEFEAQARLCWTNLFAQLEAAGMTVANLVKVTTFLSSRDYAMANRAVRREMLGAHVPALTVVIAEIFDERWLLEIEAIAAD
jgi:enamine deaminase RidA (YjgF/YER057c/UK114 family)